MKIAAPVAGSLLGFLDFVWIKYVPAPFGGLGNSVAVWAVAAFLFAYGFRSVAWHAVAGAVVMLVVAVPSYYVAASLIQHDDWSNAWNRNAWLWAGFGVIAGVIFGSGGVLARRPGRLRLPALGLPAAVLFAELFVELGRIGDASYRTAAIVEYSLLLAALAVLIIGVIGRTWRDRTLALACVVPLGGAGCLLMTAAGFQ